MLRAHPRGEHRAQQASDPEGGSRCDEPEDAEPSAGHARSDPALGRVFRSEPYDARSAAYGGRESAGADRAGADSMFFIRRARVEDQATLLKLAKTVHFINLPADPSIIASKVAHSRTSFLRATGHEEGSEPGKARGGESRAGEVRGLSEATRQHDLFMFVVDDTDNPGALGSSQLVSQMGGPGNPNVCFKLEKREKYSKSLKTGTTFVVARLYLDESGPTEIGGLVLQPSFRGHPARLGRFISMVRFHFIGLFRERFRDTVLAEMMAPITPDGANLLWEYLGRRFIPLSYTEADRFCQYDREFMTALLPQGDIQLSLLPPEARSVVGEVGPETVPARRMLERLGFAYTDLVDPFDGGPFLTASTDSIPLVRATSRMALAEPGAKSAKAGGLKLAGRAIVSRVDNDGEFRAVCEPYALVRGKIALTREAMETIHAAPGDEVGVTPLDAAKPARRPGGDTAANGSAGALDAARASKPRKRKAGA